MEKVYYTCKEVAERYAVKEDTVWEWIRTGKLEAYKIGRMYRVHKDQLAKFEEQNA